MVPKELIAIFNPSELELLSCGLPEIDLDDMQVRSWGVMEGGDGRGAADSCVSPTVFTVPLRAQPDPTHPTPQ